MSDAGFTFFTVAFPFSLYKKVSNGLTRLGIVTKIEYGMDVTVQIATETGSEFVSGLNNLCATQMDVLYEGEAYYSGGDK